MQGNALSLTNTGTVFVNSFQVLFNELIIWLPRLVVAIIIWGAGRYLLELAASWISKIDIPGTKIDDKLIAQFNRILVYLGQFLLVLIILDYLGIGATVIGAIANGLTITVALILGISFGLALKPEAEKIVKKLSKTIK